MSIITLNLVRSRASHAAGHTHLSAMLTALDHIRSHKYIGSFVQSNLESNHSKWVKKIRQDGYVIVKDFINKHTCDSYLNEIDYLIEKHPQHLHKNIDDQRIYGAENISPKIRKFSSEPLLQMISTHFNQAESRTAFCLAARLPYSPSNKGSGGGWHRDSCLKQFKAILYLSDVTTKNGPFQLISKSNNLFYKIADCYKANQPYMGYRFTNKQVEKILDQNPSRLITFCAPAGTLILVDTSCIHRGKPIEEGERHALFNYYYPNNLITSELLNQFSPIAQ